MWFEQHFARTAGDLRADRERARGFGQPRAAQAVTASSKTASAYRHIVTIRAARLPPLAFAVGDAKATVV
jgi:hypothetical protein